MTNLERTADKYLASYGKKCGGVKRDQVQVIRAIAAAADKHGVTDPRHLIYMLATAKHESNWKMIREIRAQPGTKIWVMQDAYWRGGYFGRGPCQLTWLKNYQKFEERLGVPLVKNPDLALDVKIGCEILVDGMVNGLFTGKKLLDYIKPSLEPDWINARRIVNGNFHDDIVAVHALRLYPHLCPDLF